MGALAYLRIWNKNYTHIEVEDVFGVRLLEENSLLKLPDISKLIPVSMLEDFDLKEEATQLQRFLKQAQLQHTRAYALQVDVGDLTLAPTISIDDALRAATGTTGEEIYRFVEEQLASLVELEIPHQKRLRSAGFEPVS